MARPLRTAYEGAIYRTTVGGHGRQALFRGDQDRRRFVERLAYDAGEFGVRVYAYCLMTNHCRLVVETPRANVRKLSQAEGVAPDGEVAARVNPFARCRRSR